MIVPVGYIDCRKRLQPPRWDDLPAVPRWPPHRLRAPGPLRLQPARCLRKVNALHDTACGAFRKIQAQVRRARHITGGDVKSGKAPLSGNRSTVLDSASATYRVAKASTARATGVSASERRDDATLKLAQSRGLSCRRYTALRRSPSPSPPESQAVTQPPGRRRPNIRARQCPLRS